MGQQITLTSSQFFETSREKAFAAWTKKEDIEKWYGPKDFDTKVLELDVRVGGKYRFAMHGSADNIVTVFGVFQEIDHAKKLVFTWNWVDANEPETTVVVVFKSIGSGTEVSLTHFGFLDEERKSQHSMGWVSSLSKLKQIL